MESKYKYVVVTTGKASGDFPNRRNVTAHTSLEKAKEFASLFASSKHYSCELHKFGECIDFVKYPSAGGVEVDFVGNAVTLEYKEVTPPEGDKRDCMVISTCTNVDYDDVYIFNTISEACKFARCEARKTNRTVEVVLIGGLIE